MRWGKRCAGNAVWLYIQLFGVYIFFFYELGLGPLLWYSIQVLMGS